ncbi:NADPH2:quinone reductase [Stenotrophomonas maltophilia SKK35]|nr:NADPH2:quinone reductase [Stenotrophomonas maltophilia SKK35]
MTRRSVAGCRVAAATPCRPRPRPQFDTTSTFPGTPPMRAAQYASFADPADVLAVADVALPEPGPGEVRIRTVLASIHNHDLLTVRGLYGYKPTLPAIAGSEALGVIDALGEGVDGLQIGQRVAAASVHGTWAEAFIAPARMVIPMPDAIADEMAAQLIAMPLSALMLLEFLHVEPGQWIVQNTANGAVGKSLAMLARARGVHVANLVRNADAVAQLQALGIDHVFDTSVDGWKDRVRAATGEAQAAAAGDSIGGGAS